MLGSHVSIASDEDFVSAEPYAPSVVELPNGEQTVWLPGDLEQFHVACHADPATTSTHPRGLSATPDGGHVRAAGGTVRSRIGGCGDGHGNGEPRGEGDGPRRRLRVLPCRGWRGAGPAWMWGGGEQADVFLGPLMITLFTRAIYEGTVALPAEGFLHPALFTDDLDAELAGHTVVWGPAVVEGAFGRRRSAFVEAPGGIRLIHGAAHAPGTGLGGDVTFTPFDRPVRATIVGLGRIYDLNVRGYVDNEDVEVVALVDPDEDRRRERQTDWPDAASSGSVADLAASGSRSTRSKPCCRSRSTRPG